jgi:GNAT superfamily N-acetyltransferase
VTILVRALEHDAEIDAFCALAATTFAGFFRSHCTPEPDGSLAHGWRRFNEDDPGFEASRLRGAFVDDTLVGGYIHDERWLCLDNARLRTGYIGVVLTNPSQRGLGVGSALMRDSIDFARTRRQALLILRGIPDFYHRFGFTDVMEVTEHAVESERVLGLQVDGMHVRLASLDDAPALLELYERHYYPFTGAFSRTLGQQQHLIRQRSNPPLLAVDDADHALAAALLSCIADRSLAVEAVADTRLAALACSSATLASARFGRGALAASFGSSTYHCRADNLPLAARQAVQMLLMARPVHQASF